MEESGIDDALLEEATRSNFGRSEQPDQLLLGSGPTPWRCTPVAWLEDFLSWLLSVVVCVALQPLYLVEYILCSVPYRVCCAAPAFREELVGTPRPPVTLDRIPATVAEIRQYHR